MSGAVTTLSALVMIVRQSKPISAIRFARMLKQSNVELSRLDYLSIKLVNLLFATLTLVFTVIHQVSLNSFQAWKRFQSARTMRSVFDVLMCPWKAVMFRLQQLNQRRTHQYQPQQRKPLSPQSQVQPLQQPKAPLPQLLML